MKLSLLRAPVLLLALAACSARPPDDDGVEDTSGDESELTVGEVVTQGTALRVTATALNLRASGATSAAIVTVLAQGAIVTCVETSGGDGWVHVASGNDDGWVHGKFVVRVGGGDNGGASGPTCAPSRAQGAVSDYEKALHDAIAYAEGTRGFSKDGYDVLFSFKTFTSCQAHPNKCLKFGSSCSTAAGRYQFLTKTWGPIQTARNLDSFEPENQERAAAYLIRNVRHVTVPTGRAMTASELSNAMDKLSWEWASLPPGRYGQPNKTLSQLRAVYCAELGGC